MATRPIQFTGMEERHTPKSELLLSHPSWGVAGGGEASELRWYENGVTWPQVCLNATGPRFVIPAIGSMPRTPIRGRNPRESRRQW